jgi:hypothetical protein
MTTHGDREPTDPNGLASIAEWNHNGSPDPDLARNTSTLLSPVNGQPTLCATCLTNPATTVTLDIPTTQGGTVALANLRPSCQPCATR